MNKPELSTTKGHIAEHYDNFIGGKRAAPLSGKYFDDISRLTGKVVCKIPRSDAQATILPRPFASSEF
jgi:aldehyde dehydrogenase